SNAGAVSSASCPQPVDECPAQTKISSVEFLNPPRWRPVPQPLADEPVTPQILAHVERRAVNIDRKPALGHGEVRHRDRLLAVERRNRHLLRRTEPVLLEEAEKP